MEPWIPLPPEPHTFSEVAGLVVRSMTGKEERLAAAPFGCTHAVAWEWRGQPVAHEFFRLGLDATSLRRVNLTHERPAWFWRETWRPVVQSLQERGCIFVRWIVRPDSAWVDGFHRHFGTASEGIHGDLGRMTLHPSLIRFRGWPERRTAGAGWEFRDGPVVVREATEVELPTLSAWLADTVPSDRLAIAMRMLHEWWHLDHGSIPLGYADGVLVGVRTARELDPDTANIGHPSTFRTDAPAASITVAVREWLRTVGFKQARSWVSDTIADHPRVQATLARGGWRRMASRHYPNGTYVELEMTL